MKTEPSVKLIKKEERKGPEPQAEVGSAVDPNRWSTTVQSWVSEFQKHRRDESLPAFDSLFKMRYCAAAEYVQGGENGTS